MSKGTDKLFEEAIHRLEKQRTILHIVLAIAVVMVLVRLKIYGLN